MGRRHDTQLWRNYCWLTTAPNILKYILTHSPLQGKSQSYLVVFKSWDFFMNEAKNFMTCTHSFPPHELKNLFLLVTDSCEESSYWKLHTERKKWRCRIKDLHRKRFAVGVLRGWWEGDSQNKRPSARRHRSAGELNLIVAFSLFPEFKCLCNLLSSPHRRSFHRKKTQRSAWHISTSYTRTCCHLLRTTTFFWLNSTPTSGRWRAGLSAPNHAGEVSDCIFKY